MEKYVYVIKDRETNNCEMNVFNNLKDAELKVEAYEIEDKENGIYEENSYEIIRNFTEEYKKELVDSVFIGYIEEIENDEDIKLYRKIIIDLNVFDDYCKIKKYTQIYDNDYICLKLSDDLNKMLKDKFKENGFSIYRDIYLGDGRFKNVNSDTVVAILEDENVDLKEVIAKTKNLI